MSQTAIVLGGGIAGLTAAHELCERGFAVRVYELRDVPGGKARSVVVASTAPPQNVGAVHLGSLAAPVRRDLPGEHGFRFFPRFYKHVVDTMERIPVSRLPLGRRTTWSIPAARSSHASAPAAQAADDVAERPCSSCTRCSTICARSSGRTSASRPEEFAFFGERIWQILTSCAERRLEEYERIGWWDFIGAEQRSDAYQKLFGIGLHPLGRRRSSEARQHQDDRRHVRPATSSTSPSRASARTGC